MSVKRSGEYQLACGHTIDKPTDIEARQKCPECGKDTVVIRVLR